MKKFYELYLHTSLVRGAVKIRFFAAHKWKGRGNSNPTERAIPYLTSWNVSNNNQLDTFNVYTYIQIFIPHLFDMWITYYTITYFHTDYCYE